MAYEPLAVLGLEISRAARNRTRRTIEHILARHAHAVDYIVVKVSADRAAYSSLNRASRLTDRHDLLVVLDNEALIVYLHEVGAAML